MGTIRGVEERIDWFDRNRPDQVGMCANYTWKSFGNLPAWGCPDANAVVKKAKTAGVLHTDDDPPRGAIVLWTSNTHGHMALSLGNRRILSTDYPGARDTGEADITMPRKKWGHKWAGWLDTYNGVTFPVGERGGTMSDYYYSGKPAGTLKVGQDYQYLDIDEWDPAKAGVEDVMCYLNCSDFDMDGPGVIRVCFERSTSNSDRFGYQDFVVVPGIPELLITHASFEKGDGTRTWTMIRCLYGLKAMTVGTRYMKRTVR